MTCFLGTPHCLALWEGFLVLKCDHSNECYQLLSSTSLCSLPLFFYWISERVIPCLYFEAELKQAPCRVKQMGFINKETKEKIYCDIHDGHLQLPKTSSPSSCEQERVPDIVGCAFVLSTGQVMFTLDGVPTGQFYDFPTPIDRLSPYISCTRIRCNYGQRSFLFEDANTKESFSCSGSLLYNCLRSVKTVKKH